MYQNKQSLLSIQAHLLVLIDTTSDANWHENHLSSQAVECFVYHSCGKIKPFDRGRDVLSQRELHILALYRLLYLWEQWQVAGCNQCLVAGPFVLQPIATRCYIQACVHV